MNISKETLQLCEEMLSQCSVAGNMAPDEIEKAAAKLANARRELANALLEIDYAGS